MDDKGTKKKSTTLTPGSENQRIDQGKSQMTASKAKVPRLQLAIDRPRLKIISSRSSNQNSDPSKSRDKSQNKSDDEPSGVNKSNLRMIHAKLDPHLIPEGTRKKFEAIMRGGMVHSEMILKKESNGEKISPGSMHQSNFKHSPMSFSGGGLSPGKIPVHDLGKSHHEVKAMILNSYKLKEKEQNSSLSGSDKHIGHLGIKKNNFNLEELVRREEIESSKIENSSTNKIQGKSFFPGTDLFKEESNNANGDFAKGELDEGVVLNKISAKFISPQHSPPDENKSFFKSNTLGGNRLEASIKPQMFAEIREEFGDSESEGQAKIKTRRIRSHQSRKYSDNRNTIYGVAGFSRSSFHFATMSPQPSCISPLVTQKDEENTLGSALAKMYGKAYPSQVTYVSFTGDNQLLARVDTSNGNLLAIYQGALKDGLPSGMGTLKYSAEEFYEGEWEGGLAHGQGKLVTLGYSYNGSFRDGVFDGAGNLEIKGKGVYQGHFFEGKFQGKGKFTWSSQKKIYIGTWKQGLFHGKGLMIWPDGRKFYGEYQRGLKHGKGLCVFASGLHKHGQWFKGTLVQSEG